MNLSQHTIKELRELADKEGISLTGVYRKADIIAAIEAALDHEGTLDEGGGIDYVEPTVFPRSVRVQRIYESQESG